MRFTTHFQGYAKLIHYTFSGAKLHFYFDMSKYFCKFCNISALFGQFLHLLVNPKKGTAAGGPLGCVMSHS